MRRVRHAVHHRKTKHFLALGALGMVMVLSVVAGLILTVPPGAPAAEPSVAITRPAELTLKVLFAGDSISRGFASTTPDKSFVELTKDELAAGGPIESTIAGQPGQTVAEAAAAVLAAGEDFDVVILELGTNDYSTTDPRTFRAGYSALLTGIRQDSPDAQILCLGAWGRPDAVRDVDGAIQAECEESGGIYRPLHGIYPVLSSRWMLGIRSDLERTDTLHPSDIGHRAIAEVISASLRVR